MRVLVTGSCGLIGSEAARHYDGRAEAVVGIDNNMRAEFFGEDGDTAWMRRRLEEECESYRHVQASVTDRAAMNRAVEELKPDLILHCAAQPSHDLAARIPTTDFEVNAVGTLNLLEAARAHARDAVFVFMSTNKVYGDGPNRIEMKELESRWAFDDPHYEDGIPETFPIDQCLHTLFGDESGCSLRHLLATLIMVNDFHDLAPIPQLQLNSISYIGHLSEIVLYFAQMICIMSPISNI